MKTTLLFIVFLMFASVLSFAQKSMPAKNYTLPKNDFHYRMVKDWIEDKIDTNYHHPSASTIETFRDIKLWSAHSLGVIFYHCKRGRIMAISNAFKRGKTGLSVALQNLESNRI